MTKSGKERLLGALLILGSVLAAVKLIFVDYSLDEEYQIVMAYRQLSGDNLFGAMWEPHQTSAFACVFLMRIFTALTGGTTGVVIFLRLMTTLIQALLSVWLYRVLCRITEREYAFLLGLCYFNIVPKLIQIPEFSNLQLWSITIIVLALENYRNAENLKTGRRLGYISPYMFRDLEICHFSIVDPTSYDEKLLTYWELYPEKRLNVIVVDCWYGQLMEQEDSWIMQFIENDFGYTRMEEGKYVRFYFRE